MQKKLDLYVSYIVYLIITLYRGDLISTIVDSTSLSSAKRSIGGDLISTIVDDILFVRFFELYRGGFNFYYCRFDPSFYQTILYRGGFNFYYCRYNPGI